MNDIHKSDDIDLIHLIEAVWDGKWTIIAITAACIMGFLGFKISGPAPSFVATTTITSISLDDAEKYRQSNNLDFFAVFRDAAAKNQAQDREKETNREKKSNLKKRYIIDAL